MFGWHKSFEDGRDDVNEEQRAERPLSSQTSDNVVKIKAFLDSDRRMSVQIAWTDS